MIKNKTLLAVFCVLILLISCKKKKLIEVVEVPLPSKEEKITMGSPSEVKANDGAFQVYKLPFAYDDFSPSIDALTMETHYSVHYLNYTNKLNKALEGKELENAPIEELFKKLNMNDAELRNNLGGYYNHTLYFEILSSKPTKVKDTLAKAIDTTFGSFEEFKKQFSNAAEKQFGSGWAWLVVNKKGMLQITTSANQDNPLMPQQPVYGTPIMCIDVWEHAYYLSYQNRRKKYIDNFFNIINWSKIEEKYEDAIKK